MSGESRCGLRVPSCPTRTVILRREAGLASKGRRDELPAAPARTSPVATAGRRRRAAAFLPSRVLHQGRIVVALLFVLSAWRPPPTFAPRRAAAAFSAIPHHQRSRSPGLETLGQPRPSWSRWSPRPRFLQRRRSSDASARRFASSSSSSSSSSASGAASGGGGDEAEWRAVLGAFKLYRAAYGDLKVPQRFVVPTLAPWPKSSQGLKLGKIVQEMRATGRYLGSPATAPIRRQALEDLGFVWRVRQEAVPPAAAAADEDDASGRAPSPDGSGGGAGGGGQDVVPLDQLYRALKAYRQLVVLKQQQRGASLPQPYWEVPNNYYVPDLPPWPEDVRGMPLGREVQTLKRRVARNPVARERFESLGIANLAPDESASLAAAPSRAAPSETTTPLASANDIRFHNVYLALKIYKAMYGDLLVPQPFTVPKTKDWPADTWGLRLGARVNAIRSQGTFVNNNPERRKLLDDLGFAWYTPKDRTRRRGRRAGDEEDEDDGDDADAEAGNDRDELRTSSATDDAGAEDYSTSSMTNDDSLFDESFDFGRDFIFPGDSEKSPGSPTWGLVEGGADFPDLSVAMEVEPVEDEYAPPRSLAESLKEATARAIEVGVIEGMTPNKRVIKGKQQKDIPWFNDDFGEAFVFEDVVEALTVYKSVYGDFSNLTEDFVVLSPKEVTGFLGEEDDDDDFSSIPWFESDPTTRAAAAIASYQSGRESSEALQSQERESQVATATQASVPGEHDSSGLQWPEALAGMQLGSIVARIRDGSLEVKHLPERRLQLDALNFDWGNPEHFLDVPFEKAMCAFYAYYLIRGDLFVYEDFIMPDEDPWPEALAGYEIGKAVKRIRELQNFLEAYHTEKVSLLRMIDFVWFPTMALPLDPSETEMNTELLLLSAMGHPDYAKMIDIPMGLPDKIIADGPFFETDDPKLWWRKWHNWDYVKDYWYQQGRRDNAYVLRRMGYPMMAAEHEAKYGPGLFTQINETLEDLESGFESRPLDEKRELLETLDFYRQELFSCTDIHPQHRDKLMASFDEKMMALMKDPRLRTASESALQGDDRGGDEEFESVNGVQASYDVDDDEDMDDQDVEVETDDLEIDIEDELGLGLE